MTRKAIVFTPASLLIPPEGNGVRAVLPTLELALRRGAWVVALWPGESAAAARWAREALGNSPFVACPRERWPDEVGRIAAEAASGGRDCLTVGVGAGPEDDAWLLAAALRFRAGEGDPAAWRLAVEEALADADA